MDNEHNRAIMEDLHDPVVGPGAHRDGSPEVPALDEPLDPLDPMVGEPADASRAGIRSGLGAEARPAAPSDDLIAAGATSGVAIDELAERVPDDARLESGWTGSGNGEDG